MQIFGLEQIHKLREENNQEWNMVLDYFEPLMKFGVNHFISNMNAEIKILKTNNVLLPLIITDFNYQDCLYISYYSHYISYIKEEFEKENNKLSYVMEGLGKYIINNKMNKAVYVNNWLISTNFYPDIKNLSEITSFLKEKFKDYAIIFKSIYKNEPLYKELENNGYDLSVSRQVFIKDKNKKINKKQRRKIRHDMKLLENSKYKIDNNLIDEDYKRIKELYFDLYIEKYSNFNPKYTEFYFKLTDNCPPFNLDVFKFEDKIYSLGLSYKYKNKIMSPALGYDRTMPLDSALYRILVANLISKSFDCEILNMSAGVGDFKMQRGALPVLEYMGIYYKHLPFKKRIYYKFMSKLTNFIIPILQKNNIAGFVS